MDEKIGDKFKGPKKITKASDLQDQNDCTICLFIPFHKFMTLPSSELRRIKENANLLKLQPDIMYYIS